LLAGITLPTGGAPTGFPGGAPTGGAHGVHPSFAHPWAGTLQMWPYGRPPPPPPAFTVVPQYGVPGGHTYGTSYAAPPPQYAYGGAAPSPPAFQGPMPAYQMPGGMPWNPTHGGTWNADSLA